jgi:hypothetical protein
MKSLKRSAVIITPKRPFMAWANSCSSWNTDKTLWPEVMDKKMFWQWFDMELVWDVVDGERE